MKMKRSIIHILFVLPVLLLLAGCVEDKMTPLNKGDQAPAPVSDVEVERLPGGAILSYSLPRDKNILYVKAVYEIRKGVEREVKSSYYKNYLQIDGFPDTATYQVKLYAVSRGEELSEPVTVAVTPLTPPVRSVFETLTLQETFGGVRISFENDSEAKIVLTVLAQDSTGDFVPAETFYTERLKGNFSARGFAPEPKRFGVFVRDRWNNHSDTLFSDLTPWFERELDKSKFREVLFPSDTYEGHVGSRLSNLWNGLTGHGGGEIFHTKPGTGLPQWFTFDLGVTTVLSRFRLHHRDGNADGPYTGGDPYIYEIYGSNEPSDDWESWTLLTTCQSVKPSGSGPQVTTEDKEFAVVQGEDFDFPPGIPPVRYLRFKIEKVWGPLDHHYIAELTFWGGEE